MWTITGHCAWVWLKSSSGRARLPANLAAIFVRLAKHGNNVLATRATPEQFKAVKSKLRKAEYHELARAITLSQDATIHGKGKIVVVSAGTSDIPVAEEAVVTAEVMGNEVQHVYDVGVAGIHRLLAQREVLTGARVVIVCAGMEGALPSVVGGLVGVPVIAVPTSVGYGASFQGLECAARNAEFLRVECVGGEHRQWIRRGLCGVDHQSAGVSKKTSRTEVREECEEMQRLTLA